MKVVINGQRRHRRPRLDPDRRRTHRRSPASTGTDPAVTDAPVNAGTYTLSESDGPAGYTACDWSCTGDPVTVTDGTVTIAIGDDVTCTITNTAQPAQLTLVKTVINDNGGTAEATDWTLTAAGPTAGHRSRPARPASPTPPSSPATYDPVRDRRPGRLHRRRLGLRATPAPVTVTTSPSPSTSATTSPAPSTTTTSRPR